MHTMHANTLTAGLAAGCPRCADIVAMGDATSPGFDDRPVWEVAGYSNFTDWAADNCPDCEHCDGDGHYRDSLGEIYADDCPHCEGSGYGEPTGDVPATPDVPAAPSGDCYGCCKDCGDPLYRTGKRGRARQWCGKCRPEQVQQGRRMPWEVDRAAVRRACNLLGITGQVYVKRSPGKTLRGRYHGKVLGSELHRLLDPNVKYHYITIAAAASSAAASRTLWHELTHAAQSERDPQMQTKYGRIARRTGAVGGTDSAHDAYLAIPYEIEARKNSALHDTAHALIASVDLEQHVDFGFLAAESAETAQREWDAWAAAALAALEAEGI